MCDIDKEPEVTRTRRTTTSAPLPAANPIVDELRAFGLTGQRIPPGQYVLSQLDPSKRTVQVRHDPDDETRANDYAVVLRSGGTLGTPLITRDHYIIDGSGRVRAYQLLGLEYAPEGMWMVDIDWEAATESEQEALQIIAATFNSNGPKPLSDKELRNAVSRAVHANLTNDQIGRRFHAKPALIGAVRAELVSIDKLSRAGVGDDVINDTPKTILRELGRGKAAKLLTRPYRNLADLVQDADLKVGEVRSEVAELDDLTSEEEQIRHISDKRTEMSDRIREVNLRGVAPVPPPAAAARRSMGTILKHEANWQVLLPSKTEHRDVQEKHLDYCRRTAAVLQKVIRKMEDEMDEM